MAVESSFGEQIVTRRVQKVVSVYRWVGTLLLLVIGYIHLALLVNMFGLSQMAGKLFLLNAIGAVAAIILMFLTPRWYGWVLGILVAGGAAFAKLGITRIAGLRQFIMGRRGGGFRPPGGGRGALKGTSPGGGAHAGHFAGAAHSVLPMFTNVKTLGAVSIVIEIAFVILALVALITMGFTKASHN
ncbi:hypothetical protein [Alicyclobacillus mengziensis]|uniref:Uncharacterized protein n=1 Tax=Alicyclobacillus mengziensis TaxID=2931921 RepID=A0A9X7W2X5_9BACL|nr:hypothetical protein [Alicyclobacillus mengziensis]QSO49405.1 hypothetical protein JZ786_11060 [Alicyclobacillus mengziensis]